MRTRARTDGRDGGGLPRTAAGWLVWLCYLSPHSLTRLSHRSFDFLHCPGLAEAILLSLRVILTVQDGVNVNSVWLCSVISTYIQAIIGQL